jgi:hypothetical protein
MQSVPITTSCEFEPRSWQDVLITTLCDKVCQWLVTVLWFSPVTSTNETDCHDITEILLKVALRTITLTLNLSCGSQLIHCLLVWCTKTIICTNSLNEKQDWYFYQISCVFIAYYSHDIKFMPVKYELKVVEISFLICPKLRSKILLMSYKKCLTPLSTIFHSYIVAVSFIGGGNRRKPLTCRNSLTNFIT